MFREANDRLSQWNFYLLNIKLKFYGLIYITNDTNSYQYRLWQLWSKLLILVVGVYTFIVYLKIIKNTLFNEDYDQVIEDCLLFVEICSFLLAITLFYTKVHLKRKEILKLFTECQFLYKTFNFSSKKRSLHYFLIIKTLSNLLCCSSLLFVITKYLIFYVGDYICKIILFAFLFSVYSEMCAIFYAVTLFFVHVNDCLYWTLLHLMKYDINQRTLRRELVKVVQVYEKFLDLKREALCFLEPFVFLSIAHLAFGVISEMAQIYVYSFEDNEYEVQIIRGSVFLAFYIPQLYGHCHGMELLVKSHKQIQMLLSDVQSRTWTEEKMTELYQLQLLHTRPNCSVFGLFTCNFAIFFAIWYSAINYLITIIQFTIGKNE